MSDRLVWITGASSGLGRALAIELARRGDRVIASARGVEQLDLLMAETTGRITAWPLDITDHQAVIGAVAGIEAAHGPIDVAILNAGSHEAVDARDFRAEGLRGLCALNLLGTASCLEGIMGSMLARHRGRIAVVSSVASYRVLPTAAYYAASKAAVTAMTEALKFDCDRAGVTMQVVHPGFIDTPLTRKNAFPMPFLMKPDDAARRLADGLEGNAFEIAFPRRLVWLMKVLRVLPYRLYFPLVARGTGK